MATIIRHEGKEHAAVLNHPGRRSELPVVTRDLLSRAGATAAAAAAGVLALACPAVADVTVDPAGAPQGTSANLRFTVINTGRSAITRVKLVLPADTPVAEVFPLSVDNWAPQITNTTLAVPLTGIHGGAPVTETASAVTWIAVRGKAIPPGGRTELAVALGPLPYTSRMRFTLQPTYADGKPGPALAPVSLALTPAAAGEAPTGHSTHGAATADEAAFAAVLAEAAGPGLGSVAGWVVAAVAVAGAAVMTLRGRRSPVPADVDAEQEETTVEDEEPVAAGARVSNWRYRDDP
jgi:hypothetical protein